MSWKVFSAGLLVSAVIASVAFAPPINDRWDRNDAAPGGAPAKAAAKRKKVDLDQDLVTILYRVGLQAENLTAAGVSSNDASGVVAGAKAWLADNASALSKEDDRSYAAVTNRDALVRKVQSGLGSKDDVALLDAAVQEFSDATAARDRLLTAAFNAGTAGLSSDAKTTLTRSHANLIAWNLPLQYAITDRTQEDWVALRDALDNERVSTKEGEQPDAACQDLLSQVRAELSISGAKTNLDTKLGDVQTSWDAAAARQ